MVDAARFQISQGAIDPTAHCVYQREVGKTNKTAKIGTDNMHECVTVIGYDPKTRNTALMHVDVATDPKSIISAINGTSNWDMNTKVQSDHKIPMGEGRLENKFDIYIVGNNLAGRSENTINLNKRNIDKVATALSKIPTKRINTITLNSSIDQNLPKLRIIRQLHNVVHDKNQGWANVVNPVII